MGVALVEVDAVGGDGVDGEAADDIGRFAVGLSGRGGEGGYGGGCGLGFWRGGLVLSFGLEVRCWGRRVDLYRRGSAPLGLVGARCW